MSEALPLATDQGRSSTKRLAVEARGVVARAQPQVSVGTPRPARPSGGRRSPTRNRQLMQPEAGIGGLPIERSEVAELPVMGAAYLAGISSGAFTWDGLKHVDRGAVRCVSGESGGASRRTPSLAARGRVDCT
jgi:hypothetical protein